MFLRLTDELTGQVDSISPFTKRIEIKDGVVIIDGNESGIEYTNELFLTDGYVADSKEKVRLRYTTMRISEDDSDSI